MAIHSLSYGFCHIPHCIWGFLGLLDICSILHNDSHFLFCSFAYGNCPGVRTVLILLEASLSDTLCQVILFLPHFS